MSGVFPYKVCQKYSKNIIQNLPKEQNMLNRQQKQSWLNLWRQLQKETYQVFPPGGTQQQFPPSHGSLVGLGSVSMVLTGWIGVCWSGNNGKAILRSFSDPLLLSWTKQIATCGQIIQKPKRLVSVILSNDCEVNWGLCGLSVGDPWIEMWKPGVWFAWGLSGHLVTASENLVTAMSENLVTVKTL